MIVILILQTLGLRSERFRRGLTLFLNSFTIPKHKMVNSKFKDIKNLTVSKLAKKEKIATEFVELAIL